MFHLADAGALSACEFDPRARLDDLARAGRFDRPTLLLDTGIVQDNYRALAVGLGPEVHIHYAVKANPAREVLETLLAEGAAFDAASRGEIEQCLALGARPQDISFGNTVKRAADIAYAHAAGITLFAADSAEELHKLAEHAPGARVYLRLLVEHSEADWPLSRKFGCAAAQMLPLFTLATALGLSPEGVSFHVGSQTREPQMWRATLDEVACVWASLHEAGFAPAMLNIGGGFPADYGQGCMDAESYGRAVIREIRARFGDVQVMAEPGRSLVAEAGAIAAEVMLVSRKSANDLVRWVYLDIGKFSGLAETIDEAIRYELLTPHDGGPVGPCVLAGPSCDSADVLYEKRPVMLPLGLRSGDRVVIRSAGAYTLSYASVGFNGFPPLDLKIVG